MLIGECLVATPGRLARPRYFLSGSDRVCRRCYPLTERLAESFEAVLGSGVRLLAVLLAGWLVPWGSFGRGVVNATNEASLDAALQGGGEVTFTVNGVIPITRTKAISVDTALNAAGRQITLSGTATNRLFQVNSNISLTIVGLTLSRGSDTGKDGADGTAGADGAPGQEGAGGAVYVAKGGRLHAVNAIFATNSATGGAGGAGGASSIGSLPGGQGGRAGYARGGAIFSNGGEVRLTNCVFLANTAKGGDGGPGGGGSSGLNGGDGGDGGGGGSANGGALCSAAGALIQLVNCAFSGNGAGGGIGGAGGFGSGGLGFDGVNGSAGEGLGGAISCADGRIESVNCTFDQSRANGAHGWEGKAAPRADPGENGRGGARGGGGAIAFLGGSATFTNCTFYANAVNGGNGGDGGQGGTTGLGGDGGDGGNGGEASGGGIYNAGATNVLLVNCTFASNVTEGGARGEGGAPGTGLGDRGGRGSAGQSQGGAIANSLGRVTLQNTLLADSSSDGNASGVFFDGGHNLSSDASPVFTAATSLGNTNAHLGTFAEYGGPTKTVALLPDSPARDNGDSGAALLTDQRGYARSGLPDIGAYEYLGIPPAARLDIQSQSTNVVISWPAGIAGYRVESTLSLTPRNWVTVNVVLAGEHWVATNPSTGTSQFYRLAK